jgi:hypothetical protein
MRVKLRGERRVKKKLIYLLTSALHFSISFIRDDADWFALRVLVKYFSNLNESQVK